MRKFLLIAIMSSSAVAQAREKIEVETYQFHNTFSGLAQALEYEAAPLIKKQCSDRYFDIHRLDVTFQLGRHSSGEALPGKIIQEDGDLKILMPHHPFAKATIEFTCKSE